MYLAQINISKFRLFESLELKLNRGLNILVGENDSGKTALIDAIRHVLGTNSNDRLYISEPDFYDEATELTIQLKFSELDTQANRFVEHLSHEEYEDAPATAAAIASDTEGDHGDSSHGDGDHGGHHLTPEHEPREPAWTMTVPLLVLAVFATVSGLLNLPFGNSFHVLEDWLDPALSYDHAKLPGLTIVILALVAIAVAFVGIWFAWRVYQRHKVDPSKIEQPAFEEALYIDAAYAEVVGGPGEAAFQGVADFDSEVVDGGVNGVGRLALLSGRAMRGLQSGFVRAYALAIAGGTVALLVFVILRMSS